MSYYDTIKQKHSFEVPASYRRMHEMNLLDSSGEQGLIFSDLQWLPLERIAAYGAPSHRSPDFLPFAKTGHGDTWSWAVRGPFAGAVVLCPHDSSLGKVHAMDFVGHIYRLMIEECSCCWLAEDLELTRREVVMLLKKEAAALAAFFPDRWNLELSRILSRPPRELDDGELEFIPSEEADVIILRDLALSQLNESIVISA